ncbi:T9SS type B sorting domain-containing protein [Polaribacter sargassicola]|uniref:T9SS type B sorting domain-containing protein n=1 Tax=Polaribacter sargassicola TaxID=2836891 RepID=UPI001F2BEEA3|nr:T9SS type B sorting domain-containing protein [Polaribacter sp. DS7-9]MCG1037005.1 T9SS type B sorting domain-containing protein [Polaribacter sp. DS7-9]
MKNYFFLTLFISFSFLLNAQKQTNNWYFGNKAALNFNLGDITILSDSNMNASNGSTSISDENGNLLFYSDGNTVWNNKHLIMENGNDIVGEKTNSQSSLIVPKPNSNTNFYLFTTRKEDLTSPFYTSGLYYSEIEISSSYPSGKVIDKNHRLISSTSEKITATFHKNGKDVWVVTNGNPTYDKEDNSTMYAFKVTDNGVQVPVVTTGLNDEVYSRISTPIGQMKFSPDGSKIAFTNGSFIFTYNFDNETGVLTKDKFINTQVNFTSGYLPYGVEFSQDSKILYYSSLFYSSSSSNYTILQLDLSLPSQDFLGTPIFTSPFYNAGSLQIGSDGKIYATLQDKGTNVASKTIGVINFPEKLGIECEFTENLTINHGELSLGLPNFIQSYFVSRILTNNQCYVDNFSFTATSYIDIKDIKWDFGDGITAFDLNPTHKYDAPGEYKVIADLTLSDNTIIKVFEIVTAYELPNLKPNQELFECDNDTDGLATFNLNFIAEKITDTSLDEELIFYLSQDDMDMDNNISNPEMFNNTVPNQQIFVKAINKNGCFNFTTFNVTANFIPVGNVSDYYTCKTDIDENGNHLGTFNLTELEIKVRDQLQIPSVNTVKFYPSYVDAQTNLNQLENQINYQSSTIYVKIQDPNLGCSGIVPINLIVNPEPIIDLENSYTICFNPTVNPITLTADISNDSYEWRDSLNNIISTNKDFTLNKVGQFSLTVYKTENGITCSNTKEFSVINPDPPTFYSVIANTEDKNNNTIEVNIDGNSSYEFSLDNNNFSGNSTSYTFTQVNPGLHTVYIRDINNCEQPAQTNITVIGFKNFFTPNGDGKNDYWNVDGLTDAQFKSVKIIIFDRYGKVLYSITDFSSLGWDGTSNGKLMSSNNYWFIAEIIDINDNLIKETGNFSLIRN